MVDNLTLPTLEPSSRPFLRAGAEGRESDSRQHIVAYWERTKGQCNRHKLDFDSPRTLEAASSLGLTFEDCLRRRKSKFFEERANPKIAELTYIHHCKEVDANLKKVYEARNKLIKKVSTSTEYNLSKKFVTHSSQPDLHAGLGKIEKRDMKNFIQRAWKELLLLESDEKRTKPTPILSKQVTLKSSERTSQLKSTVTTSVIDPIPEQAGLMPQTTREVKSQRPLFMTQTDVSDIDRQIEERKKGRLQILENLRKAEQKQRMLATTKEREWSTLKAQLDRIEQKLEQADSKVKAVNWRKSLGAVQSSSNIMMIQERALANKEENLKNKQAMYIDKARKIQLLKKEREVKIQAEVERRKKKQLQKKERQSQERQKQVLKEQKAISLYAEQIELKAKEATTAVPSEQKEYQKEIAEFNKELQKENQRRINKINEYRRKQILDLHQSWKKANEIKNEARTQYDAQMRKQAVVDKKMREELLMNFQKMVKGNLTLQGQRHKMATTLQHLNAQLNLGLNLEFPPVKRESSVVEVAEENSNSYRK